MPDKLKIALARPDQAEAISHLISGVTVSLDETSETEGARALLALTSPQAMAALLANPAFSYYTARYGESLCGVLGLKDQKHVFHLFVARAFHRRGIARALWEHAKKQALRQGNPGAFTVNASLGAAPVYERLGFRAEGPQAEKNGLQFIPMRRQPWG